MFEWKAYAIFNDDITYLSWVQNLTDASWNIIEVINWEWTWESLYTWNDFTIKISDNNPWSKNISSNASWLNILQVDITASNTDIILKDFTVKRVGFWVDKILDSVWIYSDNWRLSSVKSFSFATWEANLILDNSLTIKAWETKTFYFKVNNSANPINWEFAIQITWLGINSQNYNPYIISNFFRMNSEVISTSLDFSTWATLSDVEKSSSWSLLWNFKIKNNWNNNEIINLNSITFKETGSVNEINDLSNLKLYLDNNEISTINKFNWKYITFTFNPISIEAWYTKNFSIKWNISSNAVWTISLLLDHTMDISAMSDKTNSIKTTITSSNLWTINILQENALACIYSLDNPEPEITLTSVSIIQEDVQSWILWKFKINSNLHNNDIFQLDISNFMLNLTTTLSWVTDSVELVSIEKGWINYELNGNQNSIKDYNFSDTDLSIPLSQWDNIITIKWNYLDTIKWWEEISTTTSYDETNFKIYNNNCNNIVSNITPSSLIISDITYYKPTATLNYTPIANKEVLKWTQNITALDFNIVAGIASDLNFDSIKFHLWDYASWSAVNLTSTDISSISLYKNSILDSNLLATKQWSYINLWYITFDWLTENILKWDNNKYILLISTTSNSWIVWKKIKVTLDSSNISLEDTNSQIVTIANTNLNGPEITILDSWSLTLVWDGNNNDNEFSKTILAWDEAIIYSLDVMASNEAVSSDNVVFTLSWASLKETVSWAKLYLNDLVVATAHTTDISIWTSPTITFDNISDLNFPTSPTELKLAISTNNIGKDMLGVAVSNILVSNVSISNCKWVDSWEDVVVDDLTNTMSNYFDVVPIRVVASASNTFGTNDSTAALTFAVDSWSNTDSEGNELSAVLTWVTIEVNSVVFTGSFTISNWSWDTIGAWIVNNSWDITINTTPEVITNWEVFSIGTTAEANFSLKKDWITFTSDWKTYKMNLMSNESLGSYSNN